MRVYPLASFCLLALLAQFAPAQIPGLGKSASSTDEPTALTDPLGRSTPRGTIVAFSRATEREDFSSASLFMQLRSALQRKNAPLLAGDLKKIFDGELHESLSHMSDSPEGNLQDGLPPDRDQVGPIDVQGQKVFIVLVRVPDKANGPIWLFSSESLDEVPAIAAAVGKTWVERTMPEWMLESELLGISLGHWAVLLGMLLACFAALWLFALVIDKSALALIRGPQRKQVWEAWNQQTRWPSIVVLTVFIQFVVIPKLGFPLTFRVGYARVGLVVLVFALTWLSRRALRLGFAHARGMVRGKDRASTQSLMLLAERMVLALILVVAVIAVLILLGVESKTALAGLGVVGVALALGAQKTVENLLGGIFLLSDKALAVGDNCTIGTTSGTVEDVTMRSVRIRTAGQSLVSLPAGSLAQAGIENFATRRKILVQTTLRLRYGTNVEQVKGILAGIRALLDQDPQLEKRDSYIRLVNFSPDAIELELFVYVLTPDAEVFRAVREQLLLEVAALVESLGSALAPTRFVAVDGAQGARAAGAGDTPQPMRASPHKPS